MREIYLSKADLLELQPYLCFREGTTTFNGIRYVTYTHSVEDIGAITDLEEVDWLFRGTDLYRVYLPDIMGIRKVCGMFYACIKLESIEFGRLPNLEDAYSMFYCCTNMSEVRFTELPKLGCADEMFSMCSSLREISLPDMPELVSAEGMFNGCSNLEVVTLGEMPNLERVNGMFTGCVRLHTVVIPSSLYVLCEDMFEGIDTDMINFIYN